MKKWTINDSESEYNYICRPEVNIGDTIEILSNNQLGYKKFKVVLDDAGKKSLKTLADWSMKIYEN